MMATELLADVDLSRMDRPKIYDLLWSGALSFCK
jgi:hypothetical protein